MPASHAKLSFNTEVGKVPLPSNLSKTTTTNDAEEESRDGTGLPQRMLSEISSKASEISDTSALTQRTEPTVAVSVTVPASEALKHESIRTVPGNIIITPADPTGGTAPASKAASGLEMPGFGQSQTFSLHIPVSSESSITLSISRLLVPKAAEIPVIDVDKGLRLLRNENDATQQAKADAKAKVEELQKKLLAHIDEMGYIDAPELLRLLKTSMRFVPGENESPNIHGHPDDPPYLFKVPGRHEYFRIAVIGNDSEELLTEKHFAPAFTLAWPTEASILLQKVHQNMLTALLNFIAHKGDGSENPTTEMHDPNLSVACAIACGKSPCPDFLRSGQTEAEFPYNLIPALKLCTGKANAVREDAGPMEFIPKEEFLGNQVASNFIEIQIPVFPDLETSAELGIPEGAVQGYMDSAGNFHIAKAGDVLPVDATIGYKDSKGKYHAVMTSIERGVQEGKIPVKEGYGVHGTGATRNNGGAGQRYTSGGGPENAIIINKNNIMRTINPSIGAATKLGSTLFNGAGGRTTLNVAKNHKIPETERKKKRRKKNKRKIIKYYTDADGEEEEELVEVEIEGYDGDNESETDGSSDGSDTSDGYEADEEEETEIVPLQPQSGPGLPPAQLDKARKSSAPRRRSTGEAPAKMTEHMTGNGEDLEGQFERRRPTFGYPDQKGEFTEPSDSNKLSEGVKTGYADQDGQFHPKLAKTGSQPQPRASRVPPPGSELGYLDEKGNFQKLNPGDKVRRGTSVGYRDAAGKFVPVTDGDPKRKSVALNPKSTKSIIKQPTDMVEVEIHDENDLDEHGKPKVTVILRHRGSVDAPAEARDTADGGKVWIEGNEEVMEVPYIDEHDLDADGKPKVKRMRVRKTIGEDEHVIAPRISKRPVTRRPSAQRVSYAQEPPDYDSFYSDEQDKLVDVELTPEDRERLLEFQRHIAVQCDLDIIRGSLDLGEVVRRSFRIYSLGGHSMEQERQSVAAPQRATVSEQKEPLDREKLHKESSRQVKSSSGPPKKG